MNNQPNNLIDLYSLIKILFIKKYIIFGVSFILTLGVMIYSIFIPNEYRSFAILGPENSASESLSMLSRFSGLASIAGINMPSSSSVDPVIIGIEKIKSKEFFESFINKYDLFFELVAIKKWDRDSNMLIPDPRIYDSRSNLWVSNKPFAVDGKPSIQDAHNRFLELLSVYRDKVSGLVTISFLHPSPEIAERFVNLIVLEINEISRLTVIEKSQKKINFLQDELLNTNLSEIKFSISSLIQQEIQKISVAKTDKEYLFTVLSKPYQPERKEKPKRAVITILGMLVSLFFSSSFFMIRQAIHIYRAKK